MGSHRRASCAPEGTLDLQMRCGLSRGEWATRLGPPSRQHGQSRPGKFPTLGVTAFTAVCSVWAKTCPDKQSQLLSGLAKWPLSCQISSFKRRRNKSQASQTALTSVLVQSVGFQYAWKISLSLPWLWNTSFKRLKMLFYQHLFTPSGPSFRDFVSVLDALTSQHQANVSSSPQSHLTPSQL